MYLKMDFQWRSGAHPGKTVCTRLVGPFAKPHGKWLAIFTDKLERTNLVFVSLGISQGGQEISLISVQTMSEVEAWNTLLPKCDPPSLLENVKQRYTEDHPAPKAVVTQ